MMWTRIDDNDLYDHIVKAYQHIENGEFLVVEKQQHPWDTEYHVRLVPSLDGRTVEEEIQTDIGEREEAVAIADEYMAVEDDEQSDAE